MINKDIDKEVITQELQNEIRRILKEWDVTTMDALCLQCSFLCMLLHNEIIYEEFKKTIDNYCSSYIVDKNSALQMKLSFELLDPFIKKYKEIYDSDNESDKS